MSLLTLIQSVSRQLGLPQPNVAFSATDDMFEQLVILAQEAGDDLARDHDWSELVIYRSFTALPQQAQTGEPPPGYDRFAQNSGIWQVGLKRPLTGPINPHGWVRLTFDNLGTPSGYWTLVANVLNILPIPTGTETYSYVYVTRNWIRLAAGDQTSDVPAWTSDTNNSLIPERLLKLSTIWRWKQAKGLDYAEDMATFEREKGRYIARDRGPRTVAIADDWRIDRDELGSTYIGDVIG